MKATESIIGILAHVDAGKTTLTESVLYKTGIIRKLGRVDKKDSHFDSHYLERSRGITIFSKQTSFRIKDKNFTLIDTPGHIDFSAEMERTLSIIDYAVLVIDGLSGIQSHTETIWSLLKEYNIPVFLFINKTDRDGFNKSDMLHEIKNRLSSDCIDFSPDNSYFDEEISTISEEMLEAFLEGNVTPDFISRKLSEAVSERSVFPCYFGSALMNSGIDELLDGIEKYTLHKTYPDTFNAKAYKILHDNKGTKLTFLKITGGEISVKDTIGKEKADTVNICCSEKYTPVKKVSAGSVCVVSGLSEVTPGDIISSDGIISSSAAKLTPLLSAEIIIKDKTAIHTLYNNLRIIDAELPELSASISGCAPDEHINIRVMGRIQLEILKNIVKERFGADIDFGPCRILYKETIASPVMGYGHFEPLRHYAETQLRIEPAERNSGIVILNECDADTPDSNYQNLILTHIKEKEHAGILTGSPLTDVRIILTAARAHLKHTEGGDFREATYRAVRQGLEKADNILLEPYYSFTLRIPVSSIGRAVSDIERLHGSFMPPEIYDDIAVICGEGPVSEFIDYPEEVITYTSGKGHINLRENGYRPCHNTEEVINNIGYIKERDLNNPSSSIFCSHGAGFEVKWYDVDNMRHIK